MRELYPRVVWEIDSDLVEEWLLGLDDDSYAQVIAA